METEYHSYLLRLWAFEMNNISHWHISLESSITGEKQLFSSLEDLLIFLAQLTAEPLVSRGRSED